LYYLAVCFIDILKTSKKREKMKYELALSRKGLTREDLSKTINAKIDELHARLKDLESIDEELASQDPEAVADLASLKEVLQNLDAKIASDIEKFNLEDFKKRMQNIENMHKKKQELKQQKLANGGDVAVKTEVQVPIIPVVEEAVVATPVEVEVVAPVVEAKVEPKKEEVKQEVNPNIEANLNRLKESVQINPSMFVEHEGVQEQEEEQQLEQEQQPVQSVRPRNVSSEPKKKNVGWSLAIIAVCAAGLTFGAVNLFRNRN